MHERLGPYNDSIPEYLHSKKPYGISLGFSVTLGFKLAVAPLWRVDVLSCCRLAEMSISQAGGQ